MLYKEKPVVIEAFCYDGVLKDSNGEYSVETIYVLQATQRLPFI